jgi:hypothetical protein
MPVATAFLRIFTALVLSIPLLLSFGYYLTAAAVEDTLLRPAYVTESLNDTRLYERIYNEVLLTPEFEMWANTLVGNLKVPSEEKARLLQSVIPPDYVQSETERSLTSLVSYLNNQSNSLEVFIDLSRPVENLQPAVFGFIDQQIDTLDRSRAPGPGELAQEIAAFLASMSSGQIPSSVPMMEGLSYSDWQKVYLQAFDTLANTPSVPDSAIANLKRHEVEILATIQPGDTTTALKLASHAVAEPRIEKSIAVLLKEANGEGQVDIIDQVAQDSSRTRREVLRDASFMRTALRYGTGDVAQWTVLGFMALCTVAMAAVFVPYWRHVFFWPGAMLFLSGLLLLTAGLLFTIDIPVWASAICDEANSSSCGLSLDAMRSITSGVGLDFILPSLIVTLIGAGSVLASFIAASFLRRRA